MAVVAYVEQLVWCAVGLRKVLTRLGPLGTMRLDRLQGDGLFELRSLATERLKALHGVGALTWSNVAEKDAAKD